MSVSFPLGFKVSKDEIKEQCLKRGICCNLDPTNDSSVSVKYKMGKKKSKGQERFFTFRISHNGTVTFTGNNRKDMEESYYKFVKFIEEIEDKIRINPG